MPVRVVRVAPAEALGEGLDALRAEAGVPTAFPPAAQADAEAAARREVSGERLELPFATIDPPGSRDLDQAMHIERRGDGHRVHYAIADVSSWVEPGGALDAETHARGLTIYAPDHSTPLHPPELSAGAASLLPGQWTPAVVWTLDLDVGGELVATHVARRVVRSAARYTYEDVAEPLLSLLREVGERRIASQRARGAVQLNVPEQEVVRSGEGWTTSYRVTTPTEEWNAQISLLTGMAAAALMLRGGTGLLRVQPDPEEKALERLRRAAAALDVVWPREQRYADFVAGLDQALPAHAAILREAAGVGRGAGYVAFDAAPPEHRTHFALAAEYAHATAPLRRLQDRYVSECCLAAQAGTPVPDWVRAKLAELPGEMQAAGRRAGAVERAVVDLVEAMLLHGREGEEFDAVVIDDDLVQLADPAVRAKVKDPGEVGATVRLRLEAADPATRTVLFEPV